MAREGVLFTSAYTPSPVCVPARCSLVYGQYPHRTGCADNGDPMPNDRPSLMQLLSEAGYRTHGIGKMHFTPDLQALRGFQTREYQEELRARVEEDDYLRFLHANGFEHVYDPMGCRGEMYYIPQPAQVPARFHATQWVGDRAVEFICQADRKRPFFLFASFIHPHPPFSPPTPWNKLYRGPLMPLPKRPEQCEALHTYMNRFQNRYKYRDNGLDNNLLRVMKAYYYACISFIDCQIGRILAALEETGQLDNTLILFTSDHGEFLGDYNCFGKRSMLDAAARIPLVVRYPGKVAAGKTSDALQSLVDLAPTFLSLLGIPIPSLMSGVDQAGVWTGKVGSARDHVLVEMHHSPSLIHLKTLVDRRYKITVYNESILGELFDLQEDPGEKRNLWSDPAFSELKHQMLFKLVQAELEKDMKLRN
ncbi:MAG: sulfatase [Candidatus Sigynarchaeota archaeon]